MGRIIELSVNEKKYTLEFNRESLLFAYDTIKDFKAENKENAIDQYKKVKQLVKCAFLKHHPDITDEEVSDIIFSIEDLDNFVNAIQQIIESSVDVLKNNKGNAHWEVK